MDATSAAGVPRWAKLSPNTDRLVAVADAARRGGAEAVTLINTAFAMVEGMPGGLSGPAIHPVAVRCVHDVHVAHPDLPIIGVGGVSSAETAAEKIRAGANLVQLYSCMVYEGPWLPGRIVRGLSDLCDRDKLSSIADIRGSRTDHWAARNV
jgi:dihydroorotate dehydrogenase